MANEKTGRPYEQRKAQKLIEKIKKTGLKNPRERMNQPDARVEDRWKNASYFWGGDFVETRRLITPRT